jgi:hypothetical protein
MDVLSISGGNSNTFLAPMLKGIKAHDYAPGHFGSVEYPHDSAFIVYPLQKAA